MIYNSAKLVQTDWSTKYFNIFYLYARDTYICIYAVRRGTCVSLLAILFWICSGCYYLPITFLPSTM